MNNRTLELVIQAKDKATVIFKNVEGSISKFTALGITKFTSFANKIAVIWKGLITSIYLAVQLLNKAFNFIELGAKIEQQKEAFENLAKSYSVNSKKILEDLRSASIGTITTMNLMTAASRAMTLGLNPEQFGKLMEIARASARAMGQDVTYMFDSIVLGIGRQSKLILDNLGIIVNAEDAYKKYAIQLGINASQLSESQKRQAFLNATIEAGEKTINRMNITMMTNAERIQIMKARWQSFLDSIAGLSLKTFNLLILGFHGIIQIFNLLSQKIVDFVSFSLKKLIEYLEKSFFILEKIPVVGKKISTAFDEMKKSIEEWQKSFDLKKENDIEIMAEKLREDAELLRKSIGQPIFEGITFAVEKGMEQGREIINKNAIFWKASMDSTATNMVKAFDDIFYDGITNRFRDLNQIVIDFGNNMIRVLTQFAAKQAVVSLFPKLAGAVAGGISGVSAGTGTAGSSALGYSLGTAGSATGNYVTMHDGGIFKPGQRQPLKPNEGFALLQDGEQVIPADEARAGKSGSTVIENNYNINAVDARSFAQLVQSNPAVIEEVINKGLKNRSSTRQYIRKYT